MWNLIQRLFSFLLVCTTLFSFCSSITFASADASAPEETSPSAEAIPETEERVLQDSSRLVEAIEISIELPAENYNTGESVSTEESSQDEDSIKETEIVDDPLPSQLPESKDDSHLEESIDENNATAGLITETPSNDTDNAALLSTSSTSAHGCGYNQIDFRGMCRSNYQTIKNTFDGIAASNWGNAYSAAATMWVNNVREGGKWDYKSTKEYGPYNQNYCSYYDGTYHDITAEWMGNYNYGYTGSYLFSLETLLEGSFIVSLFDMSDVYNDWPVIIAGYNAAQSEQSNIHPVSRWILFRGNYYYFDSDGTLAIGWKKISGDWYYFNSTGIMQTGWLKYNSNWYYLNTSGVMQTGWVKDNNKWYYMNSSGAMLTGWNQIGSTYYYFESSGDWSGWIISGGYHYYKDPSTGEAYTKGWLKYNGYWYYLVTTSGRVFTGWLQYNGSYYYLSPSTGKMQTGWLKYNSYWYYLSSSGKMYASQWLKYNGYWYYFQSTGRMAVSTTLTISGTQYTFDSSGHMVT